MIVILLTLVFVLGVAWLLVGFILRSASSKMLDVPNERSSHVRPVPRGGGMAIALLAIAGWSMVLASSFSWAALSLLVGGVLVAGISWLDDLHTLSSRSRFAIHILAIALPLVVVGFWRELEMPFVGVLPMGAVGILMALVWGVGLTNAYNFMDGIDGIAALQAIATGSGWFVAGWMLDVPMVMWTGGVIAAATLGFFPYNWSPAKIFMGDVGSAFCGYVFAVITLIAYFTVPSSYSLRIPLAGLVFVWPFVFDAVYTFIRRARNRESLFTAHRSHLYQRLVMSGHSHRLVAGIYGLLAAVSVLAGLDWLFNWTGSDIPVVVCLLGVAFLLVGWARSAERASKARVAGAS